MNENMDWNTGLPVEPGGEARPDWSGVPRRNPRAREPASRENHGPDPHSARGGAGPAIDAWTFIDIILHRWRWLLVGAVLMSGLFAVAGTVVWKPSRTAMAQLMRFEPMGMGDSFKPPQLTPDTFSSLLKAPELLQRVATNANPPISTELLAKSVFIKTDPDSDLVKVGVRGKVAERVVDLANLYAEEAVRYTRDLQSREAEQVNRNYLKQELSDMDSDIAALQAEFKGLPNSMPLAKKLNQVGGAVSNLNAEIQMSPRVSVVTARLNERLQAAIDELSTLTKRYTEVHPLVKQQREQILFLQQQIANAVTNPISNGPGLAALPGASAGGSSSTYDPVYDIIRSKLQALDDSRQRLMDRQREAQAFAANPPGNVRAFAPATLKEVQRDRRWLKVGLVTLLGAIVGIAFGAGGVLLVEFADDRLKSADDVKRVTRLPVIATLGDLNETGPSARERWAFRTWTMLQGRLSPSPSQGLICGFTSSQAGEGRSTWISLLAEAASLTGFRVLTIATRPPNGEREEERVHLDEPSTGQASVPATRSGKDLTTNVLSSPAAVTEQLSGPNPQPMVHIPLPGWVWNLERRSQWQQALDHWRKIDNVVILVELPPASSPETVLLGQHLPNLIWLTGSGSASAAETRAQLETLRHAHCRFVGAALNNESARPLRSRFPRWLACAAIGLLAFSFHARVFAADPPQAPPVGEPTAPAAGSTNAPAPAAPAAPQSNGSLSMSSSERAEWQQHLTLGAGDILNLALYGQPDLNKADVFIGPDGKLSYLEADNVLAAGLTVDELRTNLDRELSKFRRAPRTVITPVLYLSKRYYVLGKVVQRGVFALDRPTTIVEAVARAHGLETGISDRDTVELADFQRSFLARKGRRIPINFEKLFGQGDLSQNIALEPDDYLYFPPAGLKEVYVVGEINFPGVVAYTSDLTVIGALSARGGFNYRAYKSRVLIVRGSLSAPKTFVVDTRAILDAREQDFKLQSRDIIYVSSRPFIQVEDLLDAAVTAFIQSATAQWAGANIGPIITHPILPTP